MQQRQDYLESQADLIVKMLRRLLEKLLKIKASKSGVLAIQAVFNTRLYIQQDAVTFSAIDNSNLLALFINGLTRFY